MQLLTKIRQKIRYQTLEFYLVLIYNIYTNSRFLFNNGEIL